ncbi:DNA-binding ferritin-like protein [Halohasta litchfieldiae]|jgi:DNA-binding ferritin-like protein|uniref:DNA-binding ferritin-like protein (Oxidative damage protectant) n=1 Tax=Halohasta litchfieldiae TaxID=1073996 RepID=A0A1H6SI30_9EURY|nr:DNA starvation/stationary phase protection protein DpsA [Halohasta litchfieldiae]ATW87862.1 DNA-binding ferritin-like protein [Halohasta litchfieldiae]SEI63425.1 DNA-binding ferritin-like protein (oxidative damage protectant) [Halohasta litchfieldiae]
MSTQKTVRQQAGEIEESRALRLEEDKVEQIVDALNTDLANAYVLYHQIHKHHWNVEGAEFRDLHLFLQEAYENLEMGADRIAERAQAIGGVPVAGPANQEERATIEFEGEDVYDIRTSLENDMEAYGDIIEGMRDHIQLAANLGDPTTEHILKEILTQVEEDAHHIEHYLEDDSLVLESSTK